MAGRVWGLASNVRGTVLPLCSRQRLNGTQGRTSVPETTPQEIDIPPNIKPGRSYALVITPGMMYTPHTVPGTMYAPNTTRGIMHTPGMTLRRMYTPSATPQGKDTPPNVTPVRSYTSVITPGGTDLVNIIQNRYTSIITPGRTNPPNTPQRRTLSRTYSLDAGATEEHTPMVNISERTAILLAALKTKVDVKIRKISEGQVSSLYHLLLDLGVKPQTIEAQLQEMPDLLHHPLDRWRETSAAMVSCGLTGLSVLQNIATAPRLLQMKPGDLNSIMIKLHSITFGKHNLLTLASRHPALYFMPPTTIRKRIATLHTMFPCADLATLIQNNPSVLTENLNTLMDKIVYIHEVMGLEQPHMTNCSSLTHSLLHIKTRHQFLFRSGVYKTPNLLRDPRSDRRNHRLSYILNYSDRFFANKVARLTEEEYETFKAMMLEEEEGDDEFESYGGSDDEEEVEEEDPRNSYR